MQIFSLIALASLWLVNTLLLWGLNHQWWRSPKVRRVLWIAPLAGAIFIGLWSLGDAMEWGFLRMIGRTLATIMLTLSIAVLVSLPFSGIALTIDRIMAYVAGKRRGVIAGEQNAPAAAPEAAPVPQTPVPAGTPVVAPAVSSAESAGPSIIASAPAIVGSGTAAQPSGRIISPRSGLPRRQQGADRRRRSFLTKTAAVIPAVTLGAAGYGLFRSEGAVLMPEITFSFPDLHPDLDGLRILHLSDIHIGYYVELNDLEKVMRSAMEKRPDLVLISGDISDDLEVLPDVLRMMAVLKPRYGMYASLGNHEYFRGIREVLRIIEAGPIPLLRDTGVGIKVGGGTLYLGGADDPVRMARREENYRFLRKTVDSAFDGAPSDAFHLLMSHRPQGFDIAADQGIHLTVAGHTHGAQMGINGRSILEPWMRDHYLWGHYQRGGSHLYTSAGVGHWFPFRLGCPPEAPVYVLKRG